MWLTKKYWIVFVCCLLPLKGVFATEVRLRLFQPMLTQGEGWQRSAGGRSWTDADYQQFIDFLNHTASKKEELNILKKWGIPHDCFDAVVFLHWIYAYQNGLAVNYKNGLNSIKYKNNPKAFIDKIIATISTRNAEDVSYAVDLSTHTALNSGLIYNYAGAPGHALYLLDVRHNGLYDRLEGPFPSQHANLERSLFSDSKLIEGASLRRMYMYRRQGNHIVPISAPSYPADKKQSLAHFFKQKEVPLWRQLQQAYLLRNAINLSKQDLSVALTDLACERIAKRIIKVNAGLRQCARAYEVDQQRCSPAQSADYSTPGFDRRFSEIIEFKTAINSPLAADHFCPIKDFNRELPGEAELNIAFQLTDSEGQLSEFFKRVGSDKAMTDPQASIAQRWGCEDPDLSCLGKRSSMTSRNPSLNISVVQSADKIHFNLSEKERALANYLIVENDAGDRRQVLAINDHQTLAVKRLSKGEMLQVYLANQWQDKIGQALLVMD